MLKILSLINDFYDNIAVKYSKYHNNVTSSSLIGRIKILAFKKINNQEIIDTYNEFLHMLIEIKKESQSLPDSVLKDNFMIELDYFKIILDDEINLYFFNETASIDTLHYLANKRLKAQQEFLNFDNNFRLLVQEEMQKRTHYN